TGTMELEKESAIHPLRSTAEDGPSRSFCSASYMFSAPIRIAAGARDLSRRNVSTAPTRPQNSKASFAHQHPCGLKSALPRSRGDHSKHIPGQWPVLLKVNFQTRSY